MQPCLANGVRVASWDPACAGRPCEKEEGSWVLQSAKQASQGFCSWHWSLLSPPCLHVEITGKGKDQFSLNLLLKKILRVVQETLLPVYKLGTSSPLSNLWALPFQWYHALVTRLSSQSPEARFPYPQPCHAQPLPTTPSIFSAPQRETSLPAPFIPADVSTWAPGSKQRSPR